MKSNKWLLLKFKREDLEKKLIELANNVNMDLETLKNICESNALDFSLIEDQIKIELFWNTLIFELYKNRIKINAEEIEERLKLIQNKEQINEYLISEILIKSVERVSKQRARVALVSLRGFIKTISRNS